MRRRAIARLNGLRDWIESPIVRAFLHAQAHRRLSNMLWAALRVNSRLNYVAVRAARHLPE